MKKGSKKDKDDRTVKALVLVTAILNLVKALIDLISKLNR